MHLEIKKLIGRTTLAIIITLILIPPAITYGQIFTESDVRIDLPVLEEPNNAITPDIASDDNGHIYVVWSDNRSGPSTIYINVYFPGTGWLPKAIPVNTGLPRPQGAPAGDATLPKVCADNSGHVYVTWMDNRASKAGTGQRDIYFRYSKDYGITWFPEFTDEKINTDSPIASDSINPQIACDNGGNVFIVWEDNRSSTFVYEVYFRSLHITFSRPTDFIEYYQFPDTRLNTGVRGGSFSARYPVISADESGHVYVAWQDSRSLPDQEIYPGIYFNVSDNHGAKWLNEAIRIDRAPVGFYESLYPAISSDSSGHVYVAWLDNAGRAERGRKYASDGTMDVYFNLSLDHGNTWDDRDIRIDTPGLQTNAKDVAIASNEKGMVGIVWVDDRFQSGGAPGSNFNVFFNHSENFGRTFLDTDNNIHIDTGASGGAEAATPRIKIDRLGDVFITWIDKSGDNQNVYFNLSVKKGRKNSWLVPDIRIDSFTPPGDSINPVMSITSHGDIYIAWQDTRDSLAKDIYNIYFKKGFVDVETLLVSGQRLAKACFIATAAYGSPYEKHVKILRVFRDRYLLTNRPGRWFVYWYYRLSPPVAQFIATHPWLKLVVRVLLLPLIGLAYVLISTTIFQKIIGAIITIILLCIFWSSL